MKLGSEGATITLLQRVLSRTMLGDQEKSIFTAQKAIDWHIVHSFFMSNLVLFWEFLYKFELVK